MKIYQTENLLLRSWLESDIKPLQEMNKDAEVMKFFPNILSADESLELYHRFQNNPRPFCFYPAEEKSSGEFIGFVGLNIPSFMPDVVEIGWRLRRKFWGKGYATEAAKKWLKIGFEECGLSEIVSFTTQPNIRSQAVMNRIGLKRDPSRDFFHPKILPENPLAFHVFYSISANATRHP